MSDTKKYLNWTARVIGGMAVLFFGIFVIPEGLGALKESQDFQFRSMMLLLAFTALAYFFALFRPKEGGVAMTLAGIVMGLDVYFLSKDGGITPVLIYSLPFLVPGLLFWWVGDLKEK